MNTPIERLQTALETLGLKAVEARLENLLEQASKKEPSYADFLDELLNCEVEARRTRYLRARLQLAHLPFVKTFEQFDFGFQPSLDQPIGLLPGSNTWRISVSPSQPGQYL
jgi:DNA replication protein DnaC